MPLEILYRAAPGRNVPVTFTLERMGPLFSFALAAGLGICVTVACFVSAVFFLSARRAAMLAVISTLGGGVGVVVAALMAVPLVGVGETLNTVAGCASQVKC